MPVIAEILRTGRLALGPHTSALEREFAELTGATHAIATSSGTTALVTAIRAMSSAGWLEGGEVLVPAHTFFAVPAAVLLAGGRIRPVDVALDAISPTLDSLVAARTDATVGVIQVHMGGIISPEIAEIAEWCRGRGMWLLEDASHAHGSRIGARHAGTFGDTGAFSMFATKVLTCGEGGLVVTDRPEVADHARSLTNLGRSTPWHGAHETLGANGRLAEISAALGRQLLRRSGEIFAHRQRIAAAYDRCLVGRELELIRPRHDSAHYKYVVMLPPGVDRPALREQLARQGVSLAGEIYGEPLTWQPALRSHLDPALTYPVAEDFCRRHVCLPVHAGMSPADARRVGDLLTRHVDQLRAG